MITLKKILYKYKNGNCDIGLYEDGTKTIEYEDKPEPEYPVSMDCKITNYCNANCAFCHENSTIDGKHADLYKWLKLFLQMPHGTEIALGGGNTISHPDIIDFLKELKTAHIVPNITVNSRHLNKTLKNIQKNNLIYGLGISYNKEHHDVIKRYLNKDTVIHIIAGYHTTEDIKNIIKDYKNAKFIILGYKDFRRGNIYKNKFSNSIGKKIEELKMNIPSILKTKNIVVSFDNLAIKQLNIRSLLKKDQWNTYFMGNDGVFTMYIDLVDENYATSSISTKRYKLIPDIKKIFKTIKNENT